MNTVQRSDLALEAFVEGSGPPLVMLGGGTVGAEGFAPHAKALAADFRVVRLQTLNIEYALKRKPLPDGYSIRLESMAMGEALDRLAICGPVDIVGWSYGGLIALDFALNHSDRVRSLTLFEPPVFFVVPREELRAPSDMHDMFELGKEFDPTMDPTDDQCLRFMFAIGAAAVKIPGSRDPEWSDWQLRRSMLRCLPAISSHVDRVDRVKSFRRPVLVMTGARTVPFHHRISQILARSFPIVEAVELSGNHVSPVTLQDEFLSAIRGFIARTWDAAVGPTKADRTTDDPPEGGHDDL